MRLMKREGDRDKDLADAENVVEIERKRLPHD
jgi:hypothetical protein